MDLPVQAEESKLKRPTLQQVMILLPSQRHPKQHGGAAGTAATTAVATVVVARDS